eukprot:TRINITY_DN9069_c0_g1_i1.p1 TRINITY_DN9069_c0_g1~~TRINITY_DN9069_c0_g1_i1.p1  ORF type:complete len:237 (-),score=41.72 TRINITY_DN9069_c0_g1_i1:73-783(-)
MFVYKVPAGPSVPWGPTFRALFSKPNSTRLAKFIGAIVVGGTTAVSVANEFQENRLGLSPGFLSVRSLQLRDESFLLSTIAPPLKDALEKIIGSGFSDVVLTPVHLLEYNKTHRFGWVDVKQNTGKFDAQSTQETFNPLSDSFFRIKPWHTDVEVVFSYQIQKKMLGVFNSNAGTVKVTAARTRDLGMRIVKIDIFEKDSTTPVTTALVDEGWNNLVGPYALYSHKEQTQLFPTYL